MVIIEKAKRFIKFGVVGGSGVVVDFGIQSILSFIFKNILNEQIINLIFPIIAYETAVINNFLLSYFWVWRDRKGNFFVNFIKYQISTLIAFGIRWVLLQIVWNVFHISVKTQYILYQFCYLVILIVVMLINFLLIEFHVFKKPEQTT
jgi:putative flippase GtrA